MKSVIFVSRRNAHLECNNVNLPPKLFSIEEYLGYCFWQFLNSQVPESILEDNFGPGILVYRLASNLINLDTP